MSGSYGNYAYVGLFLVGGALYVLGSFAASRLLAPSRPGISKLRPYECGEVSTSPAWIQFNVRFYLFAMLFVLFDVEAAFLIPWAVAYKTLLGQPLLLLAVLDLGLFLGILVLALVHAWRKGALKWT